MPLCYLTRSDIRSGIIEIPAEARWCSNWHQRSALAQHHAQYRSRKSWKSAAILSCYSVALDSRSASMSLPCKHPTVRCSYPTVWDPVGAENRLRFTQSTAESDMPLERKVYRSPRLAWACTTPFTTAWPRCSWIWIWNDMDEYELITV